MTPDAPISAQARSGRLYHALALGFGLTLLGHSAFAQAKPPLEFSIPSQPLAAALDAYSAKSGFELFYDGELALGRRSNAIEGLLAPDAALRTLLVGTGLFARSTGPNSVVIAPVSPSRVTNVAHQSYFAAIQARISQVLCARPETRPGGTDLLVQLWITSLGTVRRAQLLDVQDRSVREDAFATALNGISIGTAPPAGLAQPITVAILARANGEAAGCSDGSAVMRERLR